MEDEAGLFRLSGLEALLSAMFISAKAQKCISEFLSHLDVPEESKQTLRQSLEIVKIATAKYKEEELAMSFNGGKDCLVMLYLILSVMKTPIKTVYIKNADTFPEIDEFVAECERTYGLDMEIYTGSMKNALQEYLEHHREVKAVFVGVRRADPWSENLAYMQKTDHGWPDFIRVHPVIEWKYDEVWRFLRLLNISYCPLYDKGYTSLGSVRSTVPNPELQRGDGSYRPAYELKDMSLERIGRNVKH